MTFSYRYATPVVFYIRKTRLAKIGLIIRDHSGYRLGQWEKALHGNAFSHWLSPYPDLSLIIARSNITRYCILRHTCKLEHWCQNNRRPISHTLTAEQWVVGILMKICGVVKPPILPKRAHKNLLIQSLWYYCTAIVYNLAIWYCAAARKLLHAYKHM